VVKFSIDTPFKGFDDLRILRWQVGGPTQMGGSFSKDLIPLCRVCSPWPLQLVAILPNYWVKGQSAPSFQLATTGMAAPRACEWLNKEHTSRQILQYKRAPCMSF
jgi:hypothetical protein